MQVTVDSNHVVEVDKVLLEKTKSVFSTGFTYAPLLYLSFGTLDYFYSPRYWPIFLGLRLLHLVLAWSLKLWIEHRPRLTLQHFQTCGILWSLFAGGFINIMIFMSDGITSPYYAGLNLVAVLAIFFIPFRLQALLSAVTVIYLPYLIGAIMTVQPENTMTLVLNFGFILSSVFVFLAIRAQSHKALVQEVQAQNLLNQEIISREAIILERTAENIKLKELSNQFSPQVVKAIRSEQVVIAKEAKTELITAIFVDIVNSTQKVTTLPIDQTQKVINLFTEDCVQIFLKYDLTLDKFLGDGFLAFCNAPLKYPNYADRVVHAAFELLEKIRFRQSEYRRLWHSPFEVRIGIASGEALVGFYGSETGFKSYTGLGPVMNMASRICSQVAQPNSISMSESTVLLLTQKQFQLEFQDSYQLKGFEHSKIRCFKLLGLTLHSYAPATQTNSMPGTASCYQCHSESLYLAQNHDGFYIFQCRNCGALQQSHLSDKAATA